MSTVNLVVDSAIVDIYTIIFECMTKDSMNAFLFNCYLNLTLY